MTESPRLDLSAELLALHQRRVRRREQARAARSVVEQARAAGLLKRHATKEERIRQQRALGDALDVTGPDRSTPRDNEEHR